MAVPRLRRVFFLAAMGGQMDFECASTLLAAGGEGNGVNLVLDSLTKHHLEVFSEDVLEFEAVPVARRWDQADKVSVRAERENRL